MLFLFDYKMQRRRVDWTEGGKGSLFNIRKQVCKPLEKGAHTGGNAPASERITPASYVSRNTCLEYKFHVRAYTQVKRSTFTLIMEHLVWY